MNQHIAVTAGSGDKALAALAFEQLKQSWVLCAPGSLMRWCDWHGWDGAW